MLWTLSRGDSPLIVDVPHAGTHVPDAIAFRLGDAARSVPDTDWHVDQLYAFARETGATMLVATHSRYVVDLNRDPAGAALYPGADNTELCPTRTFANEPIYLDGESPSEREIAARRSVFHEPYHATLAAEIERVRTRHGYAILLDAHSIRSKVPRFFDGRLPDLNLGTVRGASCAENVERVAIDVPMNVKIEPAQHFRMKSRAVLRSICCPPFVLKRCAAVPAQIEIRGRFLVAMRASNTAASRRIGLH